MLSTFNWSRFVLIKYSLYLKATYGFIYFEYAYKYQNNYEDSAIQPISQAHKHIQIYGF